MMWLFAFGLSACHRPSAAPSAPQAKLAPPATFVQLMQRHHRVNDPNGWLNDIQSSLDTIKVDRSNESVCAVMAVIEQESGYQEDPAVAGLSTILSEKIAQLENENIAMHLAIEVRLRQTMASGKTFREAVKTIKTERDLAGWYSEFTASQFTEPLLKPLGKSVDDEISTLGSMQVSINYARSVAGALGQPGANMRDTLYTRRGGVLFGTAHLFYYPTHYTEMVYRFADYNAGHYASRNAAFQSMLAQLSGKRLAADGDLTGHHLPAGAVSDTQTLLTQWFAKKAPTINAQTIGQDLQQEKSIDFEQSQTYQTVAQQYAQKYGAPLTQKLPTINLKSAKIKRQLTTEWYANSVNRRYQQCFAAAQRAT